MSRAPRRAGPARPAAALAAVLVALVAVLASGCATSTATGSPPASPGSPPSAPAGASGEAAASPSGGAPQPSPTPWPGSVVEAVIVLGAIDGDIRTAGADLGAAAAYEDLEAMRGAADGLVKVLDQVGPQVDRIRDNPATAELARSYDAALPDLLGGATALRDAIAAGDAAGIAAGSGRLSSGLATYEATRALLAPLVEQAVFMQRHLVK